MMMSPDDTATKAETDARSNESENNADADASGTDQLIQRYQAVNDRVAAAAERSGRRREDIILVAVTKYAAIDDVRTLLRHGHVDFGESRVQNLTQRAAQIDEYLKRHQAMSRGRASELPASARWHMIGHLQRNKVKKVLPCTRLIHTIDSLRLAEEIQIAAAKLDQTVEVLVQVNVSGEKQKFGVAPAAARHLVEQFSTMLNIRIRGLMCMAPIVEDPDQSRQYFQLGAEVFDDVSRVAEQGERIDILSMGMSNDYEVAIECGANVVRVGSAIFGERAPETEDADAQSDDEG